MGFAKESVEERWGDPWLEDLPSTDVGTGHGSCVDSVCKCGE
jgi:hypothetical protein